MAQLLLFSSVEVVTFLDLYKDTRYSPHRAVTDLRASPTFPELFLAAYGSPSSKYATEQDAEGCVLVWSLAMKQRPEYAFTCQVGDKTPTLCGCLTSIEALHMGESAGGALFLFCLLVRIQGWLAA